MKEFRRSLAFLFFLFLVSITAVISIVACKIPFEIYTTPTPASRNAWLNEWLKDSICRPPCFMGITPGMTTLTETIKLLSNRPDIQITEDPLFTGVDKQKELGWIFSSPTANDGGRVETDAMGKIVDFIDLSTGSDQNLTLADIISSFGSPEYVYLPDCRGRQCVVHIIYMSSGMVLEPFLPAKVDSNDKHSVDISPDTKVEEIWILPPSMAGYRETFGFWADYLDESKLLWNGYGSYKEK